MSDQLWQTVRYFIILGGGFLVGKGWATTDQVAQAADLIIQIGSASAAVAAIVWGWYVTWGTKKVPITAIAEIAAVERITIPVVSSATGKVEPPVPMGA